MQFFAKHRLEEHTIATALALGGRCGAALDVMRAASPVGDDLGPEYALVRGLIASHLGYEEHATHLFSSLDRTPSVRAP